MLHFVQSFDTQWSVHNLSSWSQNWNMVQRSKCLFSMLFFVKTPKSDDRKNLYCEHSENYIEHFVKTEPWFYQEYSYSYSYSYLL